jgi:uncharacterized membrane protein YhaH (DUF805 family)
MNWLFGFSGRINRSKFLAAILIYLPLSILSLRFLDAPQGTSAPLLTISILILWAMPTCKRLHDIGHSGWWQLLGAIPIINIALGLYLLIKKGVDGPNQFGDDPLEKHEKPYTEDRASLPDTSHDSKLQDNKKMSNTFSSPTENFRNEDDFFAAAYMEITENRANIVTWAKALMEAEGDENKTKALYIKHRVDQLNRSKTDQDLLIINKAEHRAVCNSGEKPDLIGSQARREMDYYGITHNGKNYLYRGKKFNELDHAVTAAKRFLES